MAHENSFLEQVPEESESLGSCNGWIPFHLPLKKILEEYPLLKSLPGGEEEEKEDDDDDDDDDSPKFYTYI